MSQISRDTLLEHSLMALVEISSTITPSSDYSSLCQTLLEHALQVTSMRQGSLWLQEEGNLVCVASYPSDEYQQPPPVIQQVFTTAEPKYQASIEVVAPLTTRS